MIEWNARRDFHDANIVTKQWYNRDALNALACKHLLLKQTTHVLLYNEWRQSVDDGAHTLHEREKRLPYWGAQARQT